MKNTLKIIKLVILALCTLFLFNGCAVVVATAVLAPGYSMTMEKRNTDTSSNNNMYPYTTNTTTINTTTDNTYPYKNIDTNKNTKYGDKFSAMAAQRLDAVEKINVREAAVNILKMKLSKRLCKVFEKVVENKEISLNKKTVYELNEEIEKIFSEKISNEIKIEEEEENESMKYKWVVVSIKKKTAIDIGKKVIENILKENSKVYFSKELEKEILERVTIGLENH